MNIIDFIKALKLKHPHIEKYEMYEGNDGNWQNEGFTLLKDGDIEGATEKFEQLMLSKPEHHGGFESLSEVYEQTGDVKSAQMLMKHAIKLATKFVRDGSMDKRLLKRMEQKKLK